mgnify:CR=1 FL=1|tara:strand:- start:148 stop:318 length:171 start_codon:yes stop_codon:yes gene_type:complete
MINAVNALLECFVTGLFTAGLLVLCTSLGWFPVMIVQAMTLEEYEEANKEEEIDDE